MSVIKAHYSVILPLFCLLLCTLFPPLLMAEEISQCALCHTDPDRIDELTEDAITFGEDGVEISDMQKGTGYGVKQAPFDLFEKVLIQEDFLETTHGQIPCQLCHMGNPDASDPDTAHRGMLSDPSLQSAQTCGQCHDDITSTAVNSLHMNPAPLYTAIQKRCNREQTDQLKKNIIDPLCLTCHQGSCGSCHVSRPDIVGGGLRFGHFFQTQPDFVFQCLSCHSHPIASDFIGKLGKGDIHYRKYGMKCTGCHSGDELHASAGNAENRYHFKQLPACTDCHTDTESSSIPEHVIHQETVSCSVCHAAAYQNCSSCHMGTDNEGIAYSQSPRPKNGYMIGINPEKNGPRYVLLREVGIQRDSFQSEIGLMKNFSALPTYKRTSPHTIQRRTWQSADCNHCHGNPDLFLTQDDISFDTLVANRHVVLKKGQVPQKVQARRSFILSPMHPDKKMRVTADWLNKHKNDRDLLILDTRTKAEYERGHIPGARHLCFCLFTSGADTSPPYMMLPPARLAALFSGKRFGLTPKKRVVIYDNDHSGRGLAFLALKMIGHKSISFLDGNLRVWKDKKYPLAKGKAASVKAGNYPISKTPDILVNNQNIIEAMGSGQSIVVDVRNAAQHNGDMRRSDIAKRGGAIPESYSFPLRTLWSSDGTLYDQERLAWLLSTSGILPTKNKEIIATCNTNMLAAEFYMILTYLGYENVKVHDGSWAEWALEFEE